MIESQFFLFFLCQMRLPAHLAQLKVRLGEARIDLKGIGILYGRFAEFRFVAVAVPALQELLLLDVRIAIAADKQGGNQKSDEQQADGNRAAHNLSESGREYAYYSIYVATPPKNNARWVPYKVTGVTLRIQGKEEFWGNTGIFDPL